MFDETGKLLPWDIDLTNGVHQHAFLKWFGLVHTPGKKLMICQNSKGGFPSILFINFKMHNMTLADASLNYVNVILCNHVQNCILKLF